MSGVLDDRIKRLSRTLRHPYATATMVATHAPVRRSGGEWRPLGVKWHLPLRSGDATRREGLAKALQAEVVPRLSQVPKPETSQVKAGFCPIPPPKPVSLPAETGFAPRTLPARRTVGHDLHLVSRGLSSRWAEMRPLRIPAETAAAWMDFSPRRTASYRSGASRASRWTASAESSPFELGVDSPPFSRSLRGRPGVPFFASRKSTSKSGVFGSDDPEVR